MYMYFFFSREVYNTADAKEIPIDGLPSTVQEL